MDDIWIIVVGLICFLLYKINEQNKEMEKIKSKVKIYMRKNALRSGATEVRNKTHLDELDEFLDATDQPAEAKATSTTTDEDKNEGVTIVELDESSEFTKEVTETKMIYRTTNVNREKYESDSDDELNEFIAASKEQAAGNDYTTFQRLVTENKDGDINYISNVTGPSNNRNVNLSFGLHVQQAAGGSGFDYIKDFFTSNVKNPVTPSPSTPHHHTASTSAGGNSNTSYPPPPNSPAMSAFKLVQMVLPFVTSNPIPKYNKK